MAQQPIDYTILQYYIALVHFGEQNHQVLQYLIHISCCEVFFAVAMQTNILGMLNAEDKLDGTNYPMWAYMIRHVLVAKQLLEHCHRNR